MIKCLKCGTKNQDNATKCVKCGEALHPKEEAQRLPDTRFEPEMQKARYKLW